MVMSYAETRKFESILHEEFNENQIQGEVTGGLPENPESFDLEEAKEKFDEQLDDDEDKDYDGPDPHGDPWINVDVEILHDVVEFLKNAPEHDLKFDNLHCLGADHLPDDGEIVVIYHLYSFENDEWIVLKTFLPQDEPIAPSITDLYPAADWHEREAYDMLGVRFIDHPDLRRILLPPDWDGHPLRKDYQYPLYYRGLPVDWDEARQNRMSRDDFYDEAEELDEMDIDKEITFAPKNGA